METRKTTSEKIVIELKKRTITTADLDIKLGLIRGTVCTRICTNAWKPLEIFYLRNKLGFKL